MTSIEVPELFFKVEVGYAVTLPEYPEKWVVRVEMYGVELFSRTYSNDVAIRDAWRVNKSLHAEGKAYDPGPRPHRYAIDSEDAKDTCMLEFAEHLKAVLNRPDPMARF